MERYFLGVETDGEKGKATAWCLTPVLPPDAARELKFQFIYEVKTRLGRDSRAAMVAESESVGQRERHTMRVLSDRKNAAAVRREEEPDDPVQGLLWLGYGAAERLSGAGPEDQTTELPAGRLSAKELAAEHGVPYDALRTRLDRWRRNNGAGWIEVSESERGPRDPKFLYEVAAVQSVIDEMKSKQ